LNFFQTELRNCEKNRPRIKDIAEELNLSTATVSRTLSDDPRISKQVRKTVNDLATIWGVTRNPIASNLYKRASNHIGLILPEFTHHFFSLALKGIDDVVNENGYHLMINTHSNDYLKERRAVSVLNSLLVDSCWHFTGAYGDVFGDFELLSYFEFHKNKQVVTYDNKDNGISYFYRKT